MAQDEKTKLNDPNNVRVTFVNDVAGIGFLNGVLNVTLVTARFTPIGSAVEADNIVSARLRMDLFCAQSLHTLLGQIIEQNTKGPAQPTKNEVN